MFLFSDLLLSPFSFSVSCRSGSFHFPPFFGIFFLGTETYVLGMGYLLRLLKGRRQNKKKKRGKKHICGSGLACWGDIFPLVSIRLKQLVDLVRNQTWRSVLRLLNSLLQLREFGIGKPPSISSIPPSPKLESDSAKISEKRRWRSRLNLCDRVPLSLLNPKMVLRICKDLSVPFFEIVHAHSTPQFPRLASVSLD